MSIVLGSKHVAVCISVYIILLLNSSKVLPAGDQLQW